MNYSVPLLIYIDAITDMGGLMYSLLAVLSTDSSESP